jgi:Spy/CpxP family protein refolding chaperone
MNKKLPTTVLALALAPTVFAGQAAATAASPGACNMMNVSSKGFEGMLKASPQGLGNMMALVIASEVRGGCSL